MTSSLSLSIEESLINYQHYKGDIEKEVASTTSRYGVEHFDTEVVKELQRRNLINHTFYNDQLHMIEQKYIHKEDVSCMYKLLYLTVIVFMLYMVTLYISHSPLPREHPY